MANCRIDIQKGKKYALIEISTDYVMKVSDDSKEIAKLKKFYNNGGGFAGFTPEFVQKPVPKHLLVHK